MPVITLAIWLTSLTFLVWLGTGVTSRRRRLPHRPRALLLAPPKPEPPWARDVTMPERPERRPPATRIPGPGTRYSA
jgi:hypothetical protein